MNFRKRFFLFLVSLFVIVGIASCTKSADTVKISFVNDEYTVKEGQSYEVDIKIEAGSNLSVSDIKKELAYSSSDESVAKFVDGTLVGVGYGETEIKVEWSEKTIVFDTAKVIVNMAGLPDVVFGNYSPNMLKGATQQVSCSLVPTYTTATVEWSSANPEIATVDQNGVITAVAVGKATIIAASTDGVDKNPTLLEINVTESDFAINYHLNEGNNVAANPAGYNTLKTPVELVAAERTGYTFKGWYADETLTTEYNTIPAETTGDVDVYAKWEVNVYNITYNMADGVNAITNPATYTVEDEVVLAEPTKDGNKFMGWVDADGQAVTKIEKGSTGDVAVTATWEVTAFPITYILDGGHFSSIYIFENHLDMVQQFIDEFNAYTSRDAVVTVNADGTWSTNFFDRSWFADGSSKGYLFLTEESNQAKWGWMLDLINANRVSRGKTELSSSDGQAEARGDIHNFLGLCDGTGVGANSSFGGDYSTYSFDNYAANYLPKKDGAIAAPETYNPASSSIIPDPVKDDYVFLGWGSKVTEITTTANSGFWGGAYATDIFLYKKGSVTNATFSYRIGLDANDNGSYTVTEIGPSGETFNVDHSLVIQISESYTANGGWAGTADFRAAVQLGQTVVVDGDTKTGKANVYFYDIDEKPVASTITTTANSGYWGGYATNVFLFVKGSVTNPLYSYRICINKNVDGTYTVGKVAMSGESISDIGDYDYVIVVSDSNPAYATLTAEDAIVKEGSYVTFVGDPKTGSATVNFTNNYYEVAAGKQEAFTMNAVWVKIKDEHSIEYHLGDGTTEDKLPATYLTSTGLELTAVMEKAGYTFKGWSLTEDGEIIDAIPEGTRGDIDLYAVYEVINYKINYELNGGAFTKHDIDNIYENFEELKNDFLTDYATFYKLTNVNAGNFMTKSGSFGIKKFFEDETMGAKWAWMVKFMLNYNANYSGLSYMKNSSNVSNYNKYWCANIAAFLQQGKLTSPLTMNFTGIDNEQFYNDNGLKKEVIVNVEYAETYNVEQLPLALATPMLDGKTFVGWCDNEYFKRDSMTLAEGYLGEITLYAKWDDTKEIVKYEEIEYVLNDGTLTGDSPLKYELGEVTKLGAATKDGYTFTGWTLDAEGTKPVTEIGVLETGKFTVYAQYEIITYTIEYDLPEGIAFKKVVEATEAYNYKGAYTAVDGAATCTIDKVGTQAKIGDLALYNGVCLLTTDGWSSGLYWPKWGLVKDDFGGYKVVAYENGGSGGADFCSNNNCDYVLTAYDTTSQDKITAMNLQIGEYVTFSKDPATCTTTELANIVITKVTKNTSTTIDKVGTQKAVGNIAIYNGVCLLKDSGWLSGKYWKKWGLVANGDGYKVVAYDNGSGLGGADFYANNNCDYVLTAFNGDADSEAKIVNLGLTVGSSVVFSKDPAKCSSTELANLGIAVTEEYPNATVTKFGTMSNVGGIGTYYGVCLIGDKDYTWPSGTYWTKYCIKADEIGYKVVEINGGTNGKTLLNDSEKALDYILTCYSSDSNYAAIQALGIKVGDYIAFDADLSKQTNGTAVSINFHVVPASVFHTVTTTTEVEYPTTYTINDLPLTIPTPICLTEGKKFVGFYTDKKFYSDKIDTLTKDNLGNVKLYARMEDENWIEPTYSKITWELNGGTISEEIPIYGEGEKFVLETPVKEGYDFVGWLLNDPFQTNYITSIPTDTKGDITLFAVFKPKSKTEIVSTTIEVGAGKTYETISAALEAAEDGSVLELAAGEYTLGEVVSKSVTFKGEGKDVTTINVTKDVAGNINANVTFDSVKLVGAGGGAGVPGVTFQAGANIAGLTIKNSWITGTNTLVKFQSGSKFDVVLENNTIDTIGQFLLWITKPANITVSGNTIDASTCGAVANSAAALMRVRSESTFNFVNNYVKGDVASIDGLFESSSGSKLTVAYNTFENVTKYVHTATGNDITMNDNLFLNANKEVLSAVPSGATGNACASDAERVEGYRVGTLKGNILMVGAGETYETITAALAAAQAEDIILVKAGTYEEEVTVAVDNVKIYALNNFGVSAVNGTRGEESIATKAWKVTAANVTIDGMKFAEDATIEVKGDDFTFTNCSVVTTKFFNPQSSDNRSAQFGTTAAIKNLKITNCYFNSGSGLWCKGSIVLGEKVTNLTVENNKFTNDMTSPDLTEAIYALTIAGQVEINYNDFACATNQLTFDIGVWSNTCDEINIKFNTFESNGTSATCGGIRIRYLASKSECNVIGNYFDGIVGNSGMVIDHLRSTSTDCVTNIKYNYFNCAYYMKNAGNGAKVYENNYYATAQTTTTSDYGTVADKAAYDAAVEKYVASTKTVSINYYNIYYELDGGKLFSSVKYYEEGTKVQLPNPVKEDYRFLGWTTEKGSKDYITTIAKGTTGDVTLYANYRLDGLTVGAEDCDYTTIAAALAKATEGDVIYIMPGTYEEEIEVKVANLTIRGFGNYGVDAVKGQRADEIIATKAWKISANNVTIDGVKFASDATITVAADNFTMINCIVVAEKFINAVSNRYGQLVTSGDVKNFTVKYSSFNSGSDVNQRCNIAFGGKVTYLTLEHNMFSNDNTTAKATLESFVAYSIGGQIDINYNTFAFSTDQFTFDMGVNGNTCSKININYNTFEFNGVAGTHASGLRIRNVKSGAVCNIIGNNFNAVAGNTFNLSGCAAGSTTNVMYNFFDNTAFKMTTPGSGTVYFANNYYNVAQVTATSDATAITSKDALDDAYKQYETEQASKTESNVTYELNGGTLAIDPASTYVEGTEIVLPTPTKSGYTFLGWSFDTTYTSLFKTLSADTKGDITLYARLVKYAALSFELNDGTLEDAPTKYITNEVNELPTPTKDGYKFMGWYEDAGFAGTALKEIPANYTKELKLYALWQVEGTFDVTYVLNGGNTLFTSRDALVAEFVSDYCANVKSVTKDAFFDKSYGSSVNDINKIYEIENGKWAWLQKYFLQLEADGEVAADFASDAAYIRGNLHNFLNASSSSVYGITFDTFEKANGFWGLITTEDYVVTGATEIYQPSYPYHTFLGWYDNDQFTGSPVRTLTANTKLYAKWEVTKSNINYVLNNTDGSVNVEGLQTTFLATDTVKLGTPTFNAHSWDFEGWYADPECYVPYNEIAAGTCEDVTVYAKWTQVLGYKITYVLNGGSLRYSSREDVVADFLADYDAAFGYDYKTSADVPTEKWVNINFHTFFTMVLEDGTNIKTKWWWLVEYLYEIHQTAECGSGALNGIKCLYTGDSTYPSDGKYGVSYVFRAFLAGTRIRTDSFMTVDFSVYDYANGFWPYLSKYEDGVVKNNPYGEETTLKTAYLENMKLEGWYTNPEFTGEKVTTATEAITVYAKWVEAAPVTGIEFSNKPTEMKRFEVLQLDWKILPADAKVTNVTFSSSDTTVLTVTSAGELEAIGVGKATITCTSASSSGYKTSFEVEVYAPDHFEISYKTNSYTEVGGEVELVANYVKRDGSTSNYTWESKNADIATVDANGKVTGVKAGLAQIRCSVSATEYVDFYVTVLSDTLSDAAKMVVGANNSNAFTRYNLGIGAGTPAYYRDIIGSVSKLLYNDELVIDRTYESVQAGIDYNHGGKKTSTEWIVVHYTGNMSASASGKANADYFANGGGGTSIHYVTGADGVYSCLDDSLVGYHAGDGTGVTFSWTASGIKVPATGDVTPTWGLDASGYYTINGQVSNVAIPQYDTTSSFYADYAADPTNNKWINDMGLPWKIVGDEYYMGTTWWCHTQIAEGRLCSKGGNLNSIGIESAVNPENELWYTWQKTAQLVAKLLVENDLDTTRVVGHHFFSAKNCPQPMLENDLEIWKEFKQLVEYEYEKLTKYSDYTFEMKVLTGTDITSDTKLTKTYVCYGKEYTQNVGPGRIIPNETAQVITYQVTIKHAGSADEVVTLATAVNSIYSEDGSTPVSTANMGYYK